MWMTTSRTTMMQHNLNKNTKYTQDDSLQLHCNRWHDADNGRKNPQTNRVPEYSLEAWVFAFSSSSNQPTKSRRNKSTMDWKTNCNDSAFLVPDCFFLQYTPLSLLSAFFLFPFFSTSFWLFHEAAKGSLTWLMIVVFIGDFNFIEFIASRQIWFSSVCACEAPSRARINAISWEWTNRLRWWTFNRFFIHTIIAVIRCHTRKRT